jgi:hypothetical protein
MSCWTKIREAHDPEPPSGLVVYVGRQDEVLSEVLADVRGRRPVSAVSEHEDLMTSQPRLVDEIGPVLHVDDAAGHDLRIQPAEVRVGPKRFSEHL